MYLAGKGVEQDANKALKWYTLAAEQNNGDAQNAIGSMYQIGQGVEQNFTEALRWYRLSAENENAWGQYNLGYMYAKAKSHEHHPKNKNK